MGGMFSGGGIGSKGANTTDSSQKTENIKKDVVSTGGGTTVGSDSELIGGSKLNLSGGFNNTITTSDPAVLARSLDSVDRTTGAAFGTVSDATKDAFTFGAFALDKISNAVSDANKLVGKVQSDALQKVYDNAGAAPSSVIAESQVNTQKTLVKVAIVGAIALAAVIVLPKILASNK